MKTHQFASSSTFVPPGKIRIDSDPEGWCRNTGGRAAAVAAVFAFVACYVYGVLKYGLLLGIGLGWLPAGTVAWLTALAVAPLATALLHGVLTGSKYLSSRVHAIFAHR
jgi:hypothetical protein